MTRVEVCQWRQHLRPVFFTLNLMGLWPKGNEIYKNDLYMVYSRTMIILFGVVHILSQVINIYFVLDDLESVVAIIYIILIEIMASIKGFCVIVKIKILKERMLITEEDWFQPKSDHQKKLIEPSIRFWKVIYKLLLALCTSCCVFWMSYPLLDNSTKGRRLPFLAWYPYDFKISPFYEITYIFQAIGTTYLTLMHFTVDTLVAGFNMYVGCQFDLLSDNTRNFVNKRNPRVSLAECVIHHKRILSFLDGCWQFYNWIIFWHLIISGVSIGITMFQLTVIVPFSNEYFSLVSYGSGIVLQIFMYCWFGNEVEVRSNLVSYAAFESDWSNLPENIKKALLIFTVNVLRPVQISAFGIVYLSVDTFLKILKTAWSYFALLYQLSSRN